MVLALALVLGLALAMATPPKKGMRAAYTLDPERMYPMRRFREPSDNTCDARDLN